VLAAMRRSYRRERYLGIIERVRAAMPQAAITTDIIVGFPGETEADFDQTVSAVRAARFAGAYTFQYSKRPGTPAAGMPAQVAQPVVQERYERLVDVVEDVALTENRALVGRHVEVLVVEAEGRKDTENDRLTGRGPDNRLVHFRARDAEVQPGDFVTVGVSYAAPHHLVAEGPVLGVRRTRASVDGSAAGVLLGLPLVGAPATGARRTSTGPAAAARP
jgi:tRNA-2-methylthio-N6-dimethylallyladenosine synthase